MYNLLVNVISNAVKFSNKGGIIEIIIDFNNENLQNSKELKNSEFQLS